MYTYIHICNIPTYTVSRFAIPPLRFTFLSNVVFSFMKDDCAEMRVNR